MPCGSVSCLNDRRYSLHGRRCQRCPHQSHTVDRVSAVSAVCGLPLGQCAQAMPLQHSCQLPIDCKPASLSLFHCTVHLLEIFGAVQTKISQNYVTYRPGQTSSPPIPSGSRAGSVLPVAPCTRSSAPLSPSLSEPLPTRGQQTQQIWTK